ncbi:conserved hypothetical protein [Nocardia seriolae]|nr:conserved hypothetical protein [Nocardia seriolae]
MVGAVAVIFERGPVSPDDAKATVIDHYTENHDALLTQSMLFLAAAALYLWFLAALHAYQAEAEGDAGHMANVAFGAGITWVAINMIAQAFQVGLAQADRYGAEPALIATMNAVFTIAALPLAVMLAAVAVVTLRHRAFPVWLGWIAIVAAAAQLLLWWGTIAAGGPLAPAGWLSYALYPTFVIWLVPACIVMIRRVADRAISHHPR